MHSQPSREEHAMYALFALVTLPVVVVTAVRELPFDAGPTICLLLLVIGVCGLVGPALRSCRPSTLPRAGVRRASTSDRRRD